MKSSRAQRMLLFLAFPALGLALTPVARAEIKIAVVDTQRAVMETEDGLRAQARLKKLFEERQKELDGKQNQLQKEREDIEKQRGVLSQEALAKRVDSWQGEMMKLQAVFVDYNKDLQKRQAEMTQPIVQKAMGIIRRLATQSGYDLVVEKQVTPYFRGDLDLTDRVITSYNAGAASPEAASPASAQAAPAAAPPPPLPAATP